MVSDIGAETADAIVLYAGEVPVFDADASACFASRQHAASSKLTPVRNDSPPRKESEPSTLLSPPTL